MDGPLSLILDARDGATRLLSPEVGLFTCARRRGQVLVAGDEAGVLLQLGRACPLVVPEGVSGRVRNAFPERVHEPVGFRTLLYELEPVEAAGEQAEARTSAGANEAGLAFRSPQSGRFYHRPSPDAPLFLSPGQAIDEGAPVGLIEVMKTFAHVAYRPGASLPRRARFVRYLVDDGAEVEEGQPLVELERA